MENTSPPKRLRLVAKGFEAFTGPLGPINFVDGISVHPVPEPFASRLSAAVEMVEVDEDGNESPTGISHRLVAEAAQRAPVAEKLQVMTDEEKRQDTIDAMKAGETDKRIYSREELEAILEKEGVKGVRQIGNEWGVKHKQAVVLVEMILEKQSEYEVGRQKRLEAAAGEVPPLPIEPEVKITVEGEAEGEAEAEQSDEGESAEAPEGEVKQDAE